MLRNWTVVGLLVCFAAVAYAGDPPAPPPDPPEVKKTVDAFKGTWTFAQEMTMTGMPAPEKFTVTYECKETALGKAVVCTGKASGSSQPWEGAQLIGYDPFTKAVHFMAMGSDGEVHDHTCHWTSDTKLDCGTYKGGLGTQAVTEVLWMDFKGNDASYGFTYDMADGSKMAMQGTGKRK